MSWQINAIVLESVSLVNVRGVVVDGSSSFFFFSSRRRHTRLQGDWSSDVCSSDLNDAVSSHPAGEETRNEQALELPLQRRQGQSRSAGELAQMHARFGSGAERLDEAPARRTDQLVKRVGRAIHAILYQ